MIMEKIISQKITPYLWFYKQAQEAVEFYCSLFKNSKIILRSEMIVEFDLEGIQFIALNGGPNLSLPKLFHYLYSVHYWNAFATDGGQESRCGWCKDKYGLSWQIVYQRFMEMMKTGSPQQIPKVTEEMMKMKK